MLDAAELAARVEAARVRAPRTWALYDYAIQLRVPEDTYARAAFETALVTLGTLTYSGVEITEIERQEMEAHLLDMSGR